MTAPESRILSTDRLDVHAWIAGDPANPPLLLVHGNASSGVFFDRVQAKLAERYFVIAPDMRGYGRSQAKAIDATRGMRDMSDDLAALLASEALGLGSDAKAHVLGWSAGANVAMQLAMDHGGRVASLTLLNPGSPFGFGGTKGLDGTPCYEDFAGSGGGTANPQFCELIAAKDRSADQPVSPRNVMKNFYWLPSFEIEAEREEAYLSGMLETTVGPEHYPGDMTPSSNWPGVAPGSKGMNNALSPKYMNQGGFADIAEKPPVLWMRGEGDQIVSDRSMFDFGVLGELGAVPGWPGADVYPAQPMIAQTRAVLDAYQAHGGSYREVCFSDCGHALHIEKEDEFLRELGAFLAEVNS
ncbi:alpha/beta hydrolase [Pseudenhygromyxa sp. WMMC2535]|uniref:alpha/beta fold hydrolase n=1 Tax=Pseudenhygromyxa sp. WMMC2535 TaxID=2712867 RepID=UPI001557947C|nr:alpha/beta hydrolase [Pseudenhygromyxa sp. WMMC2535]NVB43313.1 alpha/beta hydrolase [Pseudenhygromyxa sp. WMMC2535]